MARVSREGFPGLIPIGGSTNLYLQIGNSAFSGAATDSTDVTIQTQLTHVDFAAAVADDTVSPATDATMTEYGLFVDRVPSSGAVSVNRSSQGAVSGLTFSYCLIGRVSDTN